MNAAWDAFRIADNHNKSMIFQLPEDPKAEEYQEYSKMVKRPISLEAIRVSIRYKVKHSLYRINYL